MPRPGDLVVVVSDAGYVVVRAGTPHIPIVEEGAMEGLEEALVFAGRRARSLGVRVWLATDTGACEPVT